MSSAPAFYQSLRDSRQLLLPRSEVRWTRQADSAPRPAEVVVNFGCGMQLTPDLMIELVDVLDALGADVAAVAGPQWCCGMPRVSEDVKAAGQVVRSSAQRMLRFAPATTVHSCGGWWPQVSEHCDAASLGLRHLSEHVARTLRELGDRVPWTNSVDASVLLHLKAQDLSPELRAERSDAMSAIESSVPGILGMIPGVRVVADLVIPPQGAPCQMPGTGDGSVASMPSGVRRDLRDALVAQAAGAGADLLVCAHHQCFREWGKFGSEQLPVRHYLSVLAEAFGLARPSRYHLCWELPSVEDIVDECAPAWRSWGLERAEAAALAARLFPSHQPERETV